MQERQEFLDRYFVFSESSEYKPPKDCSRTNGLVEDIRQSYFDARGAQAPRRDRRAPKTLKTHEPQQPLEMPQRRAVDAPARRHAGAGGRRRPREPAAPRRPRGASRRRSTSNPARPQHRRRSRSRAHDTSSAFSARFFIGARASRSSASRRSTRSSARRGSSSSTCSSTATSSTRRRSRKALADESELPYVDEHRPRARSRPRSRRACRSLRQGAQDPRHAEDDDPSTCVVADPFDTVALDDVRVLFGKPVEASVATERARSSDAINRVYEREAGGGELETDDEHASTKTRRATSSTPTTRRRSFAGSTRSSSRR